jgi:mRNA-degrading endonuclease RelE of RelBE toxin-antitoxin system
MYKIILSQSMMDYLDTKDDEFVKSFYAKIKELENDPLSPGSLEIKRLRNDDKKFAFKIGDEKFFFEVID